MIDLKKWEGWKNPKDLTYLKGPIYIAPSLPTVRSSGWVPLADENTQTQKTENNEMNENPERNENTYKTISVLKVQQDF